MLQVNLGFKQYNVQYDFLTIIPEVVLIIKH